MPPSPMRQSIPNALTIARLVLAAAFFVLVAWFDPAAGNVWVLNVALVVFIVAAATDFLDGHLARRWEVVTAFGRVMDPFCDKILVLGALIFLAGPSFLTATPEAANTLAEAAAAAAQAGAPDASTGGTGLLPPDAAGVVPPPIRLTSLSGIYPWMVVLILARELLVTSIRGVAESSGIAFPAVRAGKLKMVLQSVTVPVVLLLVANFDPLTHAWSRWTRDGLVLAMIIATIVSGLPYIARGMGAFRTAGRVSA